MSDINILIKEVEVNRLNLKPGETLVVKVSGEEFINNSDMLMRLKMGFETSFPDNKILLMSMPEGNRVEFDTILEESSCSIGKYCVDCSCGKKYEKE